MGAGRLARYDLHLHSCLSPCGDDEMTPATIVGLAKLGGLDFIALTDHNTVKNCPYALEAGRFYDLPVIPGMELCTREEVHVVCLFDSLPGALAFGDAVYEKLPDIANDEEIFGHQYICNTDDEVVGKLDKLLINACDISIYDAVPMAARFGGIAYPAHVDKSANSVLSNLGFIPPECGFHILEVAHPERFFAGGAHSDLQEGYTVVTSSDAHDLGNISERIRCIHLETIDYAGLAARLL